MENQYKNILFYTFLLIFTATTIITFLGLIDLLSLDPNYMNALFTGLIVEVIGAVILLFKSADFFTRTSEQNSMEINGNWWEMIYDENNSIVASFAEISFSKKEQMVKIGGYGYNKEFEKIARWDSNPAVYNPADNRLFYYWTGSHFDKQNLDKRYSGVGFIKFRDKSKDHKFISANGWYSKGDIESGKVELNCQMEFIRAGEDDMEIMKNGSFDQKKVVFERIFTNWKKEFGRT